MLARNELATLVAAGGDFHGHRTHPCLILLCHKTFEVTEQYGHLFNRLEMCAAIRQRSVAIESGTCRCIRWGAAWDVVRG
jgi:hypothetical protein